MDRGRLIYRHRRAIALGAVPVLLAAAALALPVFGELASGNDFDDPAAQAVKAREAVNRATGASAAPNVVALVRLPGPAGSPAAQRRIAAVAARLRGPGVVSVVAYRAGGDRRLVSRDGRSTYLLATFANDDRGARDRIERAFAGTPYVALGGGAFAARQVSHQVSADIARAELIAFPILFLLSLVVFRSALSALLPLAVGATTILLSFLFVRFVNAHVNPMSVYALNLINGLGLGLAIDYSLFMVSRFREELAGGASTEDALAATYATAGRTVAFSGVTVAAGAAVLLIALGLPFTGIRFTGIDASVLPRDRSARVVDDALRTEFPPSAGSPVYVAVPPRAPRAQVAAYARRLPHPVVPPRVSHGRIDVIPAGPPLDTAAKDLVRAVRRVPAPFPAPVGGQTAAFLDQQASLRAHLGPALAVLAATTLAILFVMTGSVVLPVKALVMNLLTLSAAFGLVVLVFQDGHLSGPLGFTSQPAIESSQPVLLFAVAFGLSTDYGVFLLGRIKELHDAGHDNEEAVALGLQRTGRIVTFAALLMMIAIGAFVTSQIVFIKQLGFGTAMAVLIDATIVRALLVPALMRLLGDWNWWAPRSLARLHRRPAVAA